MVTAGDMRDVGLVEGVVFDVEKLADDGLRADGAKHSHGLPEQVRGEVRLREDLIDIRHREVSDEQSEARAVNPGARGSPLAQRLDGKSMDRRLPAT
ncbi:hypothetical protein CFL01nite_05820 [Corynebacterium flavescens]|uniref:DUF2171 domain-containing protein n=1 Tax=Corynebacterium flavescens TaxID=28028 RepID=A0AB73B5C4_CORFL|nr:hypothetical protein CFL01nite_05820 [Corynebacterium flavescens]